MSDSMSEFRDGFVEGWKALKGGAAAVPLSTSFAPTKGRTSFQEGIRRAVKKIIERDGIEALK
jgi:hypothetical protein